MRLDQHAHRVLAVLALGALLFRLGYVLAHPKESR